MDCLRDDELERIGEWSADDPRRRHAESCPRCRARRLAFASFMAAEPEPGSRPGEARAALLDRVRRERGVPGASTPPDGGIRPAAMPPSSRRRGWGRGSLLALAAGIAIVIAGVAGLRVRAPHPPGLERGPALSRSIPRAIGAEVTPERVRFTWTGVAAAERYRVTLLGGDLRARYTSDAVADTFLVLPLPLAEGLRGTDIALWQVTALREGEVVAESAPRGIRLP